MQFRPPANYCHYILTTAAALCFSGIVCAQNGAGLNGTVKFTGTHITAGEAIATIETQSGYSFVFNASQFDTGKPVRLSREEMTISRALDEMFNDGRFQYVVRKHFIAINPAEMKQANVVAHERLTSDVYHRTDPSTINTAPVPDENKYTHYEIQKITILVPGEPVVRNYPQSHSVYTPAATLPVQRLPKLAIKTNLLYAGAALTPNIAIEAGTTARQTLELNGSYSWLGRTNAASTNHRQSSHIVLRAEYRWWTCERFNGHYFGLHALYGRYYISGHDIPLLFDKGHSYDGWAMGAGATYGYHWAIGKNWGLEFNIGAGYAYMNYRKGTCSKCEPKPESNTKHYFGPTRAGINLMFMIGRTND